MNHFYYASISKASKRFSQKVIGWNIKVRISLREGGIYEVFQSIRRYESTRKREIEFSGKVILGSNSFNISKFRKTLSYDSVNRSSLIMSDIFVQHLQVLKWRKIFSRAVEVIHSGKLI